MLAQDDAGGGERVRCPVYDVNSCATVPKIETRLELMSDLQLVEEDLRFKFYYNGQFCLAYNKGCRDFGDFYLSRPNFFPVYSPSGRPVTTNCAYRYNHHKSIFIGHAKVNGVNFFHDNSPARGALGDVLLQSHESRTTGSSIELETENDWITKAGELFLKEDRDIVWTPGEQVHVLDISSSLVSQVGDIVFEQDVHSYIGIRVADSMDVEDGGRVVNSIGQVNEEEAMGESADWLDYSGTVVDKSVGVTLMPHRDNPPSCFFVRNYGTILSNFAYSGPYTLKAGETLAQRFRILVHEGAADDVDINSYLQD